MFSGSQKYWVPVLLAESAAIVVSILFAFAIDAWWANRQERAEERANLMALKTEFETNLVLIDRERSYRNAVLSSIQQLWDTSGEPNSLEADEVDGLIGDITWWAQAEYSRGALESTVQGGRLSIVQSEELRQLLAGLPGLFDVTIETEMLDQDTTRNVVMPFLSENTSLTQIINATQGGQPGTGNLATSITFPVGERRDHRVLLNNSEFIAILLQEYWDHLDAIDQYDRLQDTLERGLSLIADEL